MCFTNVTRRRPRSAHPLWPAAGYLAQSGYRGVVAKKPRNRRGTGPAITAPAGTAAGTVQLAAPSAAGKATYPGQGLGLPEHGPGSVASMPRRVAAVFIDR